ncbi:hypothetical protein VV02_02160 [Luteipulveratus mongoliensis]|uniref:DUF262 domain-containing protein n=1 Tax=Luteipulveratus mongoliensis TaxID=571913 RepID=A0A0K1JE17_9MICO|nr:hypothetical protein VV02_02160 [Luteipulveratus mongoliensis]
MQEFLDDLIDAKSEGYFIGPMVVYKAGFRYAIVDGQQRLTTITLLLSVLRDYLNDLGETDRADGIHNFIETKDEENRKHYVLQSGAAGGHLYDNYLSAVRGERKVATNEDQRNIDAAVKDLRSQLESKLEDRRVGDATEDQIRDHTIAYLSDVRARVLSLNVIWIPLESEQQAYAIFETLNSRGKDLDTVDLVKNLVFSGLPAENADHDPHAEDWRELRRVLEEDGKRAVPNMFIHHWWLSWAPFVAERRVFGKISDHVKAEKLSHSDLLTALLNNARLYAKITNPAGAKWDREFNPVKEALEALLVFGVRQPRPLLLAALRAHSEDRLSLKQLTKLLAAVESFHYITTAVMRLSSSGGVSKMYATFAHRLTEADNKDDAGQVLTDIRSALKDRIPEDGFEPAFLERLRYSKAEADQKDLVFYTLGRLQRGLRPKHPLERGSCNVEHIHPQSSGTEWASQIGNLVWLPKSLNDELGDKSFKAKKAILEKHVDQLVLDGAMESEEWSEDAVIQRGRILAQLAVEKVWLL